MELKILFFHWYSYEILHLLESLHCGLGCTTSSLSNMKKATYYSSGDLKNKFNSKGIEGILFIYFMQFFFFGGGGMRESIIQAKYITTYP